MLDPEQISELIKKSRCGTTTIEEEALLLEWVNSDSPKDPELLKRFNDIESLFRELKEFENIPTEGMEEKVMAKWKQLKNE
jgi:hypothetical protein